MNIRHLKTIADLLAKEVRFANAEIIKLDKLIKETKELCVLHDLIQEKKRYAEEIEAYNAFMGYEMR